MGQKELNDLLGAVLTADSGSASGQAVSYVFWRVLPLYPTLRSYVKVLLDSPEFFVMFWNSVKMTGAILLGQIVSEFWQGRSWWEYRQRGDLPDIVFREKICCL